MCMYRKLCVSIGDWSKKKWVECWCAHVQRCVRSSIQVILIRNATLRFEKSYANCFLEKFILRALISLIIDQCVLRCAASNWPNVLWPLVRSRSLLLPFNLRFDDELMRSNTRKGQLQWFLSDFCSVGLLFVVQLDCGYRCAWPAIPMESQMLRLERNESIIRQQPIVEVKYFNFHSWITGSLELISAASFHLASSNLAFEFWYVQLVFQFVWLCFVPVFPVLTISMMMGGLALLSLMLHRAYSLQREHFPHRKRASAQQYGLCNCFAMRGQA